MKLRKILFLLPMLVMSLAGCDSETILPTKLTTSSSEVKVIVNSERNLNDIVTLRFEPKNTTNKEVTWTSEVNDFFTLSGSTIKANKIGKAKVTATSVANESLSTDVFIKVYDPNSVAHRVSVNNEDGFTITGLQNEYKEGDEVSFVINVTDTTKEIDNVKANDDVLSPSSGTYSFMMPNEDVTINVSLKVIEIPKKATSVTLNPVSLALNVGENKKIAAISEPIDTTDTPIWSVSEGEEFVIINANDNEVTVQGVKEGTAKVKVTYNEIVSAECVVTISTSSSEETNIKYNIEYDLGTRKTAKMFETNEELFSAFKLDGESNSVISSISQMEYIYGGGNGGRGETAWYAGNMIKFGTTSVNGSMTFALNTYVSRVKITGYVSDNASKIRVGDSASTDWLDSTYDNKTALVTCSEMVEVTKDVVEANQTTTITIDFASTMNLKIATTNKKPLYITAIEFIPDVAA